MQESQVYLRNGTSLEKELVVREVIPRLHFPIRGTGGAPVNHVPIVTENSCKLLSDVFATVSTACASCRRFHRIPVDA